ncbi:hypothetical protein [Nocardia sp. NPDC052112]|uniref:hypothetical protein n=1 Tax=Nocardia sp. NPDC052112 TaxID=3155646 RepID=UPI0034431EC9
MLSHRFRASRWRRRVGWLLTVIFVLSVFPGLVGAVASAQYQAAATGGTVSEIDGLSWMHIRDSFGVPLANYAFATNHGGVLDPGSTILWAILGFEFIGYIAIVTTAIWLIGNALSFQWLNMFGSALTGVADRVTGAIATPMLLITAATIGAFCVAWFWLRGYHAKAVLQIVTMLGVAMLGPVFLAEPLGDVLSSDGLLAKGRDLGISVAAGLNGNNNPNPNQLVATMQQDLADNFARRPVQVWNFGHVVDEQPACRSAWTAGMTAGDDERVRRGMQSCGDSAAYAKAQNPSMGQVGTGLMLLICGGILLAFAVVLGIRVIKAALDAIYHGFMSIFGFAAGGFVYGPTQTFLVRNLVDSIVAAGRMTVYTIFLGVYVLFMGNLFAQAQGQTMAVIVIAGTVEIVAISQLRRLSRSLTRGNDWIANRFALAIQGSGARPGGGGGGGSALGMGDARAGGSLHGGLMSGMGALNTINASPATAWLLGATVSPLNPLSRRKKRMDLNNIAVSPMVRQLQEYNHAGRANWRIKAAGRLNGIPGGIRSALGVGNVLDGLGDSKVPDSMIAPILLAMGATDQQVIDAQRALAVQKASMKDYNPNGFAPLQKALAAGYAVENHQGVAALPAFAGQAVVAADNFVRHSTAPINPNAVDHQFVQRVMNSDEHQLRTITPDEWRNVGRDTRQHIGRQLALQHQETATNYYHNQNDAALLQALQLSNRRLANFNGFDPNGGPNPWSS